MLVQIQAGVLLIAMIALTGQVGNPLMPEAELSTPPEAIAPGQGIVIAWGTKYATAVTLNGRRVKSSGYVKLVPTETMTLTLVATGPGGTVRRTAEVVVDGEPKPEAEIVVRPDTIQLGQGIVLVWGTKNASTVTLNGQQVAPAGFIKLTPRETTTYTLVATGISGSVTKTAEAMVESSLPSDVPTELHTHHGEAVPVPLFGDVEVVDDLTIDSAYTRENLVVRGRLALADGFDLRCRNLFGLPGSTITARGKGRITFLDLPIDTEADPFQWGNGLVSFGRVDFHGSGADKSPFLRLDVPPKAGDTTLTFAEAPHGWEVGDELGIPDSIQKRQYKDAPLAPRYSEERRIVAITGEVVTLDRPLEFDHPASPADFDGNVYLPHVCNLTRGIVIRSENPESIAARGHIAFVHHADVDWHGVEVVDCGRTDARRPLDNTKEIDGELHVGTNQIARYALHWHHCFGAMGGHPSGHQVRCTGSVVRRDLKWGYTIHGTSFGLWRNNVAWDNIGAGFFVEDANCTRNVLEHNFAGQCVGASLGDRGGASENGDNGRAGDGFWFRAENSIVRDNVAAACRHFAFNFNGYYDGSSRKVYTERGNPEAFLTQRGRGITPFGEFTGNEGYGCQGGLWLTWDQAFGGLEEWDCRTFADSLFWNIGGRGVEAWHTANVHLLRVKVLCDAAVSSRNQPTSPTHRICIGITDDLGYECWNLVVEDCQVLGCNIGLVVPRDGGADGTRIVGGRFSNHVNVASFGSVRVHPVLVRTTFVPGSGVADAGVPSRFDMPDGESDVWMCRLSVLRFGIPSTVRLENYFGQPVTVRHCGDPPAFDLAHARIVGCVRNQSRPSIEE